MAGDRDAGEGGSLRRRLLSREEKTRSLFSRIRSRGENPTEAILTETDKLLYGREDAEEDFLGPDGEGEAKEEPKPKLDLRDYNLIVAMPFWSIIAILQPFLYFTILLKETYEVNLGLVGLFSASYQLCRVISAAGSSFSPRLSHLIGTVAGMAGYVCLAVVPNTTNVAMFAGCTIIIGLADTAGTAFVYSKNSYSTDPTKMRLAMRYQSAVIGVAVAVAFLAGGPILQASGVFGVATLGAISLGLELTSLLYFLVDPATGTAKETIEDDSNEDDGEATGSTVSTSIRSQLNSSLEEGKPRSSLVGRYSDDENIAASKFTYLVSLIFGFESICQGFFGSVGPLFLLEVFKVDEGSIGIIIGASSGIASVVNFAAISSRGQAFQRRYLRSPHNIYATLIGGTVSVFGLIIPWLPTQILSIVLNMVSIETFLALVAELQGAITTSHYYAALGPTSQMFRKLINIAVSLCGPILYNVFKRLPYIISGSLCLLYTLIFIFFTHRQQKKNNKVIAELLAQEMGKEEASDVLDNYGRMSMASKEVLARMTSALKLVEEGDKEEGNYEGPTLGRLTEDETEEREDFYKI